MFDIGMLELIVLAVISILVLGPDKLPEAMKQLAKFIKKIKNMWNDATKDIRQELEMEEMKEEMKKYKEELNKIQKNLPTKDNSINSSRDMSDFLK
jgi:sec-independent protein translocase protein TatB